MCRRLRAHPPRLSREGRRLIDRKQQTPDTRVLKILAKGGDPCVLTAGQVLGRLIERGALDLDRQQLVESFALMLADVTAQGQHLEVAIGPLPRAGP